MTLHLVVKGRGVPVLLLHGLLSDHTQVYPLLPGLKGCKVYIPDLLGCGKTDEKFSVNIVRENAKLLGALCKKHKVQTVVAYSMAGMLALELQLPRTIFVSAYCTNPVEYGPLKFIKGKENAAQLLLIKYKAQLQKLMQRIEYKDVPGMAVASVEAGLYYLTASLVDRSVQAEGLRKVMVIHGTRDKLVHTRLGEELSKVCKCSALFVPDDHATVLSNKAVHSAISKFIHGQ